MADLPVGATFGSLVHGVLEQADPEAPDLRAELARAPREQLGWWPVDLDREALVDALVAVATPRSARWSGTTLRDIPLRDRLRELDFELPLAGGDRRGGAPTSRSETWPRCCAATCPPVTRSRLRRPAGRPGSGSRRCAAT